MIMACNLIYRRRRRQREKAVVSGPLTATIRLLARQLRRQLLTTAGSTGHKGIITRTRPKLCMYKEAINPLVFSSPLLSSPLLTRRLCISLLGTTSQPPSMTTSRSNALTQHIHRMVLLLPPIGLGLATPFIPPQLRG